MEIRFQNLGPEQWQAQIAIIPCCEGEKPFAQYPDIDKACPWLAVAPALNDFKAKKGDVAVLYGHPDLKLPRVLLTGIGKRNEADIKEIRLAMGRAIRKCRELGLESAILPASCLDGLPGGKQRLLEECVYSLLLGLYNFAELKTKKPEDIKEPAWLAIGFSENAPECHHACRKGEISAGAVCLARDLDNLPGNMLYPESLALRALDLAEKHGFKCEVLGEEKLQEIGAGCLLGVGQGSSHPPRLIVLEYAAKDHEKDTPLLLVGKGITFDSGGLCLKPAANMDQMKCDMSGAAAVLASITAAAIEGLQTRVTAVLACAENMPDGRAYRPGDVLAALNGQTVEVINTDAEGRLALADGLAYGQQKFKPGAIVDIATLTGACAVALGNNLAGLFCDDENLAAKLNAYGQLAGENNWRLPLWPDYKDSLKSEVADIKHTASREGGAITAALFLKNFVAEATPWAHLDIAGVDWNSKTNPLCPEGASGFGSRTLLELIRGGWQ